MRYTTTTALIVVDVQNDFADPDGSLYVPGGEETIPFINEQAREARDAGALVVYTQDWHPRETPHFQEFGGPWPVHCVAGTKGAQFHPDLVVVEGALHVKKGKGGEDGYSAFCLRDPESGEESSTGLAADLEDAGIETTAIVGLALDYCVKETALDAARLNLSPTLLADGSRAVNLQIGDGARAVAEMVTAGVEIS